MKKATTTSAAAKTLKMTGAKVATNPDIEADPKKNCGGIFLTFMVCSSPRPRKPRYQKPQAVKELEELADIANAKAHPNMPERYLARAKYRDDTANGLTQCIIDYIKLYGGHAERINTMGIPVETPHGIVWRTGNTEKGSADISATILGRSVKIEIKIGRDRQSEAQKQYQSEIESAGGLYYIAKSFTEFVCWYSQQFGKEAQP